MAEKGTVFFDMDDTIVEWTVRWHDCFVQTAAEYGVTVTAARAKKALLQTFKADYRACVRKHAESGDEIAFWMAFDGKVLAALGVREDEPHATKRVVELLKNPDNVRLFPDAADTLATLQGLGYGLGIVTSRPKADPDLERLGIRRFFGPVVDAFAARGVKGEPHVFPFARSRTTDADAPVWHVGDDYHDDIVAARQAGFRPILIDRADRYSDRDCVRITALSQLEQILG
ncbi:MAG: HAD family hydrolase [Spirochaetaceae bacterium]|nr:MAG: HAD family hydrolase [Spirochaetaceae bacterium]